MTATPSSTLPIWHRCYRIARLGIHLLSGMLEVRIFFGRASEEERRWRIQRWSTKMLKVLGVKLEVVGDAPLAPPKNSLWVANHISWLDVFVLNAMLPLQFVAKSEVANWPVIGWMCRHTGTLFIERDSKKDLLRVNALVEGALQQGGAVAFFPEGTTTDGSELKPFAASLFHSASVTRGDIYPVALQYIQPNGCRELAPAYIDEVTLMDTIWQIAGAKEITAQITLLPQMNAAHLNRRELASTAHKHIEAVIHSIPSAPTPSLAMQD
ncbi:1-acyl-sn-glycerol-3-phosphate acyltransferase [Leeia sp. TBRC 13508]|uniref:1-acyl-sn-glycerol-3-phosphate acyltransferase n=1 Tax=Leeia speluncae TaxID=2884804 RepID=A0ABS8D5J8_9NEIS|nr:lysophospholipid acyltransferase family protein [Leeia speluncae]MCB6183402.1 1-acyl-sn-glycerol-3-phosphate acyltransferase [Leeia speluncae]